ncbi:MAG: hypothetical protein ACLFQX_04025 [Candidatus Kapaibacterium sp.]
MNEQLYKQIHERYLKLIERFGEARARDPWFKILIAKYLINKLGIRQEIACGLDCTMDYLRAVERRIVVTERSGGRPHIYNVIDSYYFDIEILPGRPKIKPKNPRYIKYSPEEDELLIGLYNRGMSYKEMAERLNRSVSGITYRLKCLRENRENIKQRKIKPGKRGYTKEEDKLLIELYKAGEPIREIAKRLNRTVIALKTRIRILRNKKNINIPKRYKNKAAV